MLDRQDIDALLIGSLYGELSSTEEARLAAHLESHPADRTALADLTRAREVVRESRILQVQFEPPQSISALLIQEAVRRAPKPREEQSWFQRFMRSFMTHPAMAAAAMLVLIVGVAGTVYMRKGDHFAKQTADEPAALAPAPATESAIAQEQQTLDPVAQGSAASGDTFKVQLDEGALAKPGADDLGSARLADKPKPADEPVKAAPAETDRASRQRVAADTKNKDKKSGGELAFDANERRDATKIAKEDASGTDGFAQPPKAPAKTAAKPTAKAPPRLDVNTPGQAPKDFESTTTTASRGTGEGKKLESGYTGSTTVGGAGAGAPTTPKAPVVAADPKPNTAPPPPPAPAAAEEKPDPQLAWAKEQHGKVIAAVKAGNCQTAANIAVQISNRAPRYYASNVETDRTIKQCMQYITQQREKEAERVQRAKATQRRAADEAPAPAQSTK